VVLTPLSQKSPIEKKNIFASNFQKVFNPWIRSQGEENDDDEKNQR
jgi:hypothetical protein